MQNASLNYMTVNSFPKSARPVPTVGQKGSTKAWGWLIEKVWQVKLTQLPQNHVDTISYKENLKITEFTSLQIKYRNIQTRCTDKQDWYKDTPI